MAEVHHFAYGWITPVMAYSLSVLGSFLGLICTARARRLPTVRRRIPWLLLASVAIGGTGIWVMHFMAMLGFGVDGSEVRFDVPQTALSALVAIVVVGIGLVIVGLGRPTLVKLGVGGVITGLGVNAMHYLGIAAMRLDGDVSFNALLVGASILIAVVAATVALWMTVNVRGGTAIFGSAMVMAVAVCGMHYTGMSAMSVRLVDHGDVTGAPSTALITPIAVAVVFVVMGLVYSMLAAPTDEDRAGQAFIDARMGAGGVVGLGPTPAVPLLPPLPPPSPSPSPSLSPSPTLGRVPDSDVKIGGRPDGFAGLNGGTGRTRENGGARTSAGGNLGLGARLASLREQSAPDP